ncbi:hypothetical protein C8D87_11068 [Lentzea atacamensis]|uniref:Uncharacterized protein n=1 Tax=Lentzea atacamensis TaxID=531938 RepID=A0ABX9E2A3_9PSEU|nr:hypothetical protein [Lentzea atacamensis]RAS61120.1 hypothetical protein C8D87_11068 [Lentzea atacamensis]
MFTATLPGGQYAVEVHEGHPDGLIAVTGRILADESLRFDRAGDGWGARLATFFTDPEVEPDPAKWTTEVAIRLADRVRAYMPYELYCWHGINVRRAGRPESPGDPRPAA